MGQAAGGRERPPAHTGGPDLGGRGLRQRDDRSAGIGALAGRAVPCGGQDDRGGRTVVHGRARAVPRGGSSRPERGRGHAASVPPRPAGRRGAAHVHGARASGHPPHACAAVGAGGPAAIRLDEHPVLARLPVRLRLLQRHRAVRSSPPRQDAGAGDRRAGRSRPAGLARLGVLRGRQPHRQEAAPQGGAAARVDRVAAGQARHPLLHRGVHQPRRRCGADALDGRGRVRHRVHRHRDARRSRPRGMQQASQPRPRPGRRRAAHPARGPGGAGRVHRRVRQ